MKLFCVKCGSPLELAAGQQVVTCSSCGHQTQAGQGSSGLRTLFIVLGVGGGVVMLCLLCSFAIAVPNFVLYRGRAKQTECKTNLQDLFIAQRALYLASQKYSSRLLEVGFSPARGNRYAYFLGVEPQMSSRHTQADLVDAQDNAVDVDAFRWPEQTVISYSDVPGLLGNVPLGVNGECPSCDFTGVCVGNIDGDETLDVWSVSTRERKDPDGETIYPGIPYNDVNDIKR